MDAVAANAAYMPPLNEIGLPDGKAEYDARSAIRDLVRLYGFNEARRIVAEIINDESEGRRK